MIMGRKRRSHCCQDICLSEAAACDNCVVFFFTLTDVLRHHILLLHKWASFLVTVHIDKVNVSDQKAVPNLTTHMQGGRL